MENLEFKGTKGKWEKLVDKRDDIIIRAGKVYPNRNDFYKMTIKVGHLYDDDCNVATCCKTEEHANALLISKAPEMLEMLQSIVSYGGIASFDKLQQLIKEATTI